MTAKVHPSFRDTLRAPRAVPLRVLSEQGRDSEGFLRRISRQLVLEDPELPEAARAPFVYDEVDRARLDAVVVVPYFLAPGPDGREVPHVIFRSAARPPVLLRSRERFQGMLAGQNEPLWEVPAGLVEADEETEAGLRRAAARELCEETGFDVSPDELMALGAPGYPCPGVIAEKQYFFAARVSPERQGEIVCDGSPLEAAFELAEVPLDSALEELARFSAIDLKTEVALHRLKQRIG